MSKPITRENIDEDPWFGGQRERVLTLLNTIDNQGELIATQDDMLKQSAARETALYESLKALTLKIDDVSKDARYRTVWECAQLHLGPYKGPQYTIEFEAAMRLLEEKLT